MKNTLFFSFLFILTITAFSQKKITSTELNMEYDLPAGWESQPYFKSDWETPGGSDVCPCAVAVNTFKLAGKGVTDYLYVIIYPSDKKKVTTEKRQNLWRYNFVPAAKSDKVKTKFMTWDRQISKLVPLGTYESQFKEYSAYRMAANTESAYYLMYIIGKPAMLVKYKAEINTIIDSFKAIK